MNPIQMNSLMQQMSSMRSQAQGAGMNTIRPDFSAPSSAVNGKSGGLDFKTILQNSLSEVNQAQGTAEKMADAFVLGKTNDLAGVMIAQQKARVSTTAMIEVRNKLLESYREVMNMSV
jgi:flagellar hook-basal body complex protein FliE